MKSKRLLSLMLLCFAVFGVARAQETLTVHDGTATNGYVPVYGFYVDAYLKCEMVYPAAELGDMEAGTITGMTFYASTPADDSWGSANFQVFLTEVANATISAYVGPGTVVYEGALDGTQSEMTITFTTPYVYNGGNLLVGVYNTVTGSYKSITWAGENVTGASIQGYSYTSLDAVSAGQRNFLPKTTFTYTPGEVIGCGKPKQLAVNYTGGNTATVTWTGDATLYNIDVNGTVTNNVTSPYTLTDLEFGTTYAVKVQANCDGDLSDFTSAVNFTTDLCAPENMCEITYELADSYGDGWNGNTLSVVDVATTAVLATWTIPSGGSSASGSLALCDGREIQFVWAGTSWPYENSFTVYDINGEIICQHIKDDVGPAVGILSNYTVSCTMSSCRKPTNLAASEIGPRSATLSWTENGEARSWNLLVNGELIEGVDNPHTLTGLTPETAYTVQVSPVCEVEKWSDAITFTTLELCPKPTNVAVSDITPMSANVSWTGTASSYNLRYRIARGFHYDFETATPWVEDNFAPCTTYDGDGLTTYQITDWTPLGTYQFVGSMMTLQSGVTDFASAHGGELFGGFVAGIPADDVEHNDDYFILPSITIENGYVFEFWASSLLDNWGLEHMRVGVYGGEGTITDYLAGSATEYVEVPVGWTKYSYDLSAFAGQTIQLAINSLCPDAYILGIDDIFVGDPNEDTWDVTLNDVTSPYAMTGLTEETMYEVQVQAACGEDGESAWVSATFTTLSNCEAPTALNVTNLMPTTATLNWTGYQDGFEARYRIPASEETLFFEDFEGLEESALPEGWTSIDSDGDGNGWYSINQESFAPYCHSGQGLVTSASYSGSALTPDNWLVTPQIALQGTMRVWLRAQDPSYAAEHYAIYLSTTGNEVADFTTTLVEESSDLSGDYLEITADLSSYNGQLGYIAIRHFNCTDMFRINVDDFGIYGGEVPAGEWIVVTSDATSVDIEELDPETTYEWQVRGENRNCTNGEDEGYTAWSELGTFTTPGLCDNPNTFVFENLEATTATLTWTGYQESYNVQYRTAEVAEYYFEDWFEEDLSNWTEDNPSASNSIYEVGTDLNGYVFFVDEEVSGAQTLISTEMEPTASGTVLEFYTASTGTSTYKIGFSSTDNALASFSWSEELTSPDDNYFHPYEGEVPEGTKYFAIQFVSNDTEDGYFIVTAFDVYNLIAEAGEWVELTVNEPSVTMEPLVPETLYEVYVQGICGEEEYTEAVGGYFTTPELTTVTQTIALVEGVNWVSFYVETNLDDLKAALVEASPNASTTNSIIIKSQKNGQTLYNGTRWRGALNALDLASMYQITVPESCEITLEGLTVDPAMHPVTIKNGPNWIAFPFSESMTPTDAFGSFPVSGDKIQSKSNGQANYTNRWRGALSTLVPGQGYIYNSAASEDKVFTYPSSTSKAAQDVTISLTTGHKSMKDNTTTVLSIKKTSANTTSVDRSFAKDRKNEKKSYAKENVKSIYMFKK